MKPSPVAQDKLILVADSGFTQNRPCRVLPTRGLGATAAKHEKGSAISSEVQRRPEKKIKIKIKIKKKDNKK